MNSTPETTAKSDEPLGVVHPRLVLPLPELWDKNGQIIREFDILRVFHFYGRRRGRGREVHYMYKIATVKEWTNPRIGKQWWFHHTAEMGDGLTNGYCPYESGTGAQWAIDQTLVNVEVISSPATLHDENEKRRIPRQNVKEHAPPLARASVDHGVRAKIT